MQLQKSELNTKNKGKTFDGSIILMEIAQGIHPTY